MAATELVVLGVRLAASFTSAVAGPSGAAAPSEPAWHFWLPPVAVVLAATIAGTVATCALRANSRNHRETLAQQSERFEAELQHQRAATFRAELRTSLAEAAAAGRRAVGEIGTFHAILEHEDRFPSMDELQQYSPAARQIGMALAELQLSLPKTSALVDAYDSMFMRLAFALAEAGSTDRKASTPNLAADDMKKEWHLADEKLAEFRELAREYLTVPGALPAEPEPEQEP